MIKFRRLIPLLVLFLFPSILFARGRSDTIPQDENLVTGQLENGLTYIIRENSFPGNKAELRLVVKAGSVLESDEQRGLAHFCEHMAFNGTKSFHSNDLIKYLQSLGTAFGPDLNAYTSFDETVYKLKIPTDNTEAFNTGLNILYEWAFHISFDPEEIDKERGIIEEEWRIGRDAGQRMVHKAFPDIFKDSRYGERIPIGEMEVIRNFKYEELTSFYEEWYRPDLMAVIVVGDVDAALVEQQIIDLFSSESGIDASASESPSRPEYEVPDQPGTIYSLQSDPEADFTALQIFTRQDISSVKLSMDYRKNVQEELYLRMINQRLSDRIQGNLDPPYLNSGCSVSELTMTKAFHSAFVMTSEDGLLEGYQALLEEMERIRRFGFSEEELRRAKLNMISSEDQFYNERNNMDSSAWSSIYIQLFLEDSPLASLDWYWAWLRYLIPLVTLDEVQAYADQMLIMDNRTVVAFQQNKEGISLVTEDQLKEVESRVASMELTAHYEEEVPGPLLEELPQPGSVIREDLLEEYGLITWTLSNGAVVHVLPTEYKQDEILFKAFSPGGSSLLADEDYYSSEVITDIISEGGLGSWDIKQLQRILTGKNVSIQPGLNRLSEELNGSSGKADLETLLQLVYLHQTAPRKDEDAWASYRIRLKDSLKNRDADPRTVYYDDLRSFLYNDHLRVQPLTLETLELVDIDRAFEIYKERFFNAGDFQYLFVGNINPEELKPLVEQYIASIPSTDERETYADRDRRYNLLGGDKVLNMGLDPVSIVTLMFPGEFEWSYKEIYKMVSLADALQIRLEEKIREEESGSYSISVSVSPHRFPSPQYCFFIHFYCDPEKAENLIGIIEQEVELFRTQAPEERYAQDVAAQQTNSYYDNLIKNEYWMSNLHYLLTNGLPLSIILNKEDLLYKTLTPEILRETAAQLLDDSRRMSIIMYPQQPESAEDELSVEESVE